MHSLLPKRYELVVFCKQPETVSLREYILTIDRKKRKRYTWMSVMDDDPYIDNQKTLSNIPVSLNTGTWWIWPTNNTCNDNVSAWRTEIIYSPRWRTFFSMILTGYWTKSSQGSEKPVASRKLRNSVFIPVSSIDRPGRNSWNGHFFGSRMVFRKEGKCALLYSAPPPPPHITPTPTPPTAPPPPPPEHGERTKCLVSQVEKTA